jgi:hypothetical protein
MAVVEPLRRPDRPEGPPAPADNVVRLVDFLGPISPELVLVDPDLAPRARALLPELPWTRVAQRTSGQTAAIPARAPAATASHPLRAWHAVAAGAVLVVVLVLAGLLARGGSDPESAGSSPQSTTATRPPATKPKPAPRAPAGPVKAPITPPRFVWAAQAGASGYRVALYRKGSQVFEEDVRTAALELSPSWSYDGHFYRLQRGTYRWIVWPLFGQGAGARKGAPIVSAQYAV